MPRGTSVRRASETGRKAKGRRNQVYVVWTKQPTLSENPLLLSTPVDLEPPAAKEGKVGRDLDRVVDRP